MNSAIIATFLFSRCKSALYSESCDNNYIGVGQVSRVSQKSRRLSTGEAWSPKNHSEQALGRYSSTDSLSSYSSSASRYQPIARVVSAKSTPSLNQEDGRVEEPPVNLAPHNPLVASMSSSRSTPNLDKEAEQTDAMVSRKFRKPSVYEALASKSGLDFAPTIQGRHHWEPKERRNGTTSTVFHQRLSSSTNLQPYHCRQTSSQSTASDCTSSSCNSHAAHSRQLSGHSSYSEDEGGVQSPRSEESLLSSSDVPSYPYGRDSGHTSLPSFPSHHFMTSEESSMTVDEFRGRSHWTSQPDLDCLPSSPGSPPPPAPPVRDSSSLKYAKQGLDHHEKYPSWPVGQQEGTQRSRSWTEIPTSDGLKDKNYPRKKFLQTSYTQQLKTVLEKTEKGVAHDDARFISSLHGQYIGHLNMLQSNHHPMGRSASYEFDTVFEPPERPYAASSYDREFGRRDYNSAHSPPERDLTSEKLQHHKSQQIRQEDAILKDLSQFNNRRQSTTSPNTSSTTVSNTNANHNWWASHQNVGNSYPSETSANQNNASGHNHHHQDTPMLDRLRLESSRWSGDHDKDGRLGNNGGAGGRDSITSTTSSQETLKWHGSSSDLSVKSDKQQPHSVETVVHSARVQPPQRHNSESVLYYGVEEASAIARSVSDVNDCRRDSPSKLKAPAGTPSDNSDIAPPLPRKTRQWADQVQKNNYINRIQMQVRQMGTPRDHGGTESISGPGIRAATLAREEIQPPLSPEFAKPLSVAERIQDLERQARTRSSMNNIQHGGSGHSNRPYVSNTLKASRRPKQVVGNKGQTGNGVGSNSLAWQTNRCEDVSSSSTSLASSTTGGGGSETRMSYLDPEKKHKVSDPELKAIQKQAVWSFFERQTGISAHGRSSISNGNSSKDSAHFLSRRMAQSLPRDYLQEFKRLQQMEERKPSQHHHHASVGPVTTHNAAIANHTITSTAEKNSTRPELNESPERKDINETNAIGPHKHAHSKESGSVSQATIPDKHQRNSKSPKSTVSSRLSSSSSSSSASSISSSSPTSVTTSAYASVLQPHNRTPNVCYNTCTQTDSDIVTITEAVQTSFPEETHHLQVRGITFSPSKLLRRVVFITDNQTLNRRNNFGLLPAVTSGLNPFTKGVF